jgi:predicted phage terminase large subunit-like protein
LASTNAKDLLINIDRKKRYASFTGRSLYGTLNGACDCNGYAIADDLISGIEEAMNKDRLNGAWLKVDNNFLPRAKQSAKILWIGTRWSLSDPIARRMDILENEPKYANWKYKVVNVPALNDKDESNFEYACGVGFDTEFYQQRRASFERNNDTASWLAQYMGTPIERDGAVFAPDDLRYYNGELPAGDPDRIFMVVDPAWGGGDFVASTINYQFGNDVFVADVVYNNGEKDITQPEIARRAISNNVSAIYVEGTKMTASYGEGIDEILKEKGYRCNVQTTTKHFTGTGKEQRIFDKAPDIRERMVFLSKRNREYELFMQNVFSFTVNGKNKHDDAPDSLAMTICYTIFGGINPIEVKKRIF